MKKYICSLFLNIFMLVSGHALTVDQRTYWKEESFSISPGKKLEVHFMANTTGKYTVEKDARIRIQKLRNTSSSVNLQFFDKDDQQVEEMTLPVMTQTSMLHVRVLYPPAAAKTMRILLVPETDATLTVEDLHVSEEVHEVEAECVNLHPVFLYGDLNPYGYHSGYGGGFYKRPDGVTVWNTGFTGNSPSFPVAGGKKYSISIRGIGYAGKKSRLLLKLFKTGEKKAFHEIALKFNGESAVLQLPEEATQARLLGYDVILEEWKIISEK